MPNRLASRPGRLALGIALGLAVVALSQCRTVNDAVTGVHLTPATISARGTCVKNCNDQYRTNKASEDARHRAAIKACGHDASCKQAEDAKHKANLSALQRQRQECKGTCYGEGEGDAGR